VKRKNPDFKEWLLDLIYYRKKRRRKNKRKRGSKALRKGYCWVRRRVGTMDTERPRRGTRIGSLTGRVGKVRKKDEK